MPGIYSLQGWIGALLISLLLLPNSQNVPQASEERRKTDSSDVYEAVVRYQIKSWELAANSYCISIDGKDATKDFLERFGPAPVKRASGCYKQTIETVSMAVLDKKSGKHSVIFNVESIHWLSDSDVEVEGGYLCGSLCMAGGVYHVIRDGTHWVVKSYDVHAIS